MTDEYLEGSRWASGVQWEVQVDIYGLLKGLEGDVAFLVNVYL